MNQETQFNYEQFRQQLIRQLQLGYHNVTDIGGLLAPIVEDIGQGFEQAASQTQTTWSASQENVETHSANQLARPNRYPRRTNIPLPISLQQLQHEILTWYKEGIPYPKIQQQLNLTYRREVPIEDLCRLTDQLLPQLAAWQNRSLQATYICLWVVQSETQIYQQQELRMITVKTLVGVDLAGRRDILGYYIHQPEAVDIWPKLMTNLKKRGLQDLLMICLDQPDRFKTVIQEDYPCVEIHGCISQQMRRSLQQVSTKEKASVRKALKAVYQAATPEQASHQWQVVKESWAKRYPLLIESWEQNWASLVSPMQYPPLIRQLTQGIPLVSGCYESLHQATKCIGIQLTEAEVGKTLFVSSLVKATRQQQSVNNWGLLIQELAYLFDERVKKPLEVLGLR